MNGNSMISVVVPVYNVEDYIEKCIESILNQTYGNLQIIIVVDASEDNSEKICERYASKDKRIVLIKQPRGGVSKARNNALKVAMGEYITFVDSDDWLEKNAYETMLNKMIEQKVDAVFCGYFKETETKTYDITPKKTGRCDIEEALCQTIVRGSYQGVLWNKMFHRDIVFDKNNTPVFFDEGLTNGEDGLWTQTVLANAKHAYLINDNLYHYRVRRNGANFNSVLKMERLSELKAYEKANIILGTINNQLVDKNRARTYDKAQELRVTSYIQKNKQCERVCIEHMKKCADKFYNSKDFSGVYKMHHRFVNMLITIHTPPRMLKGINKMIEAIYNLIR